MKKVPFYLNFITIVLIVLTPNSFYNDYIILLDVFLVISMILNFLLIRFRSFSLLKNYLILSIVQLLYCLSTVSSNSELEYQKSRISGIFFKSEIFSSNLLSILENTSIFIFLFFITLEIRYIYNNYSPPDYYDITK
jgi:hypothetical protein